MALPLAELMVTTGVDMSGLRSGLSQAQSLINRSVGSGIRIPIAMTGLSAGIAAGLFHAAKQATYLYESVDKVKRTFGPSFKGVEDNVNRLANSFGTSRKEAMDASAMFGVLAQSAGYTKAASAAAANELVNMAGDLSAFYVLGRDEVMAKIASGLEGQVRPLRDVGIFLSEAAVEAHALETGLIKVKRELTEQEKVRARMSLIRQQFLAGPAVGNQAETIGAPRGQLEKLQGDIRRAVEDFGTALIPALESGVKLARELGAEFKNIAPTKAVVGEYSRGTVDLVRELFSMPAAQRDKVERYSIGAVFDEAISDSLESLGLGWTALAKGAKQGGEWFRKELQDSANKFQKGALGAPAPTADELAHEHEWMDKRFREARKALAGAKGIGPFVSPELDKEGVAAAAAAKGTGPFANMDFGNVVGAPRWPRAEEGGKLPGLFQPNLTPLDEGSKDLQKIVGDMKVASEKGDEALKKVMEGVPERLTEIKQTIYETQTKRTPEFNEAFAEVGKIANLMNKGVEDRAELAKDRMARLAEKKPSERFTNVADYATATTQGILDAGSKKEEDRKALEKIARETEMARHATEKLMEKLGAATGVRPR